MEEWPQPSGPGRREEAVASYAHVSFIQALPYPLPPFMPPFLVPVSVAIEWRSYCGVLDALKRDHLARRRDTNSSRKEHMGSDRLDVLVGGMEEYGV